MGEIKTKGAKLLSQLCMGEIKKGKRANACLVYSLIIAFIKGEVKVIYFYIWERDKKKEEGRNETKINLEIY